MLITRIELENIKSYRQIAVDFRRGTTAISGANGAGKTTLVEAIGFALFDYLPYSQARFVREGEKYGKVVVRLIGGDDRPYIVERRCGSGSRWFIHDEEANARLEQSADVLDKLHELFGIDRERPLNSLFRDALGVPQGTFTSIFLEPAGKRKQTFDALLQIEDYKIAADNLRETQNHYRDQSIVQQAEIQRLTYETRELEEWRLKLKDARLEDEQHKEQQVQWSQQLSSSQERAALLTEQWMQLQALEQKHQASQNAYQNAQQLLGEREQRLREARAAQEIVAATQRDYHSYREAEGVLQGLRQEAKKRDSLRSQQSDLQSKQAAMKEKVGSSQRQLEAIALARRKVVELAPLVEQQVELEKQRDEANQQKTRYKALLDEGTRLRLQYEKCLKDQEVLQRKIGEIEPLVPVAERLQERNEALTQLRIQTTERTGKQRQLQEKRELLREKQVESDQVAAELRKAKNNVAIIEANKQEALEWPDLQERYQQLAVQKSRLDGNIEGYAKSRAQSAGGQCPLLNESCLNIKQRGIVSLESYFESLLKEEHEQQSQVTQQQEAVTVRMGQIKKYYDALPKLDRYITRRDLLDEQLQGVAREIARLQRENEALTQELEAFTNIEQLMSEAEAAYSESKKADARVRELAGWRKQLQQLQMQVRQYELDLQERRREAETLSGSEARLKQINAELVALNDPRSLNKAQLVTIEQEGAVTRQLQAELEQQQQISQRLQGLQEQLAAYEALDTNIAQQEAVIQLSRAGHQNYLQNEKTARLLPEREQAHQQQVSVTGQAQKTLVEVEQAYLAAKAAFHEEELITLKAEIDRLKSDLDQLVERMKHHQEAINRLERNIEEAEKLLVELEKAQKEKETLEELHEMTEQFRKLIKEAAPHVLKAMLTDISAEANRIFGEVMGDRGAQLSWQEDYEIVLHRQGAYRSFAQLSGGEQMSAALSVRLALLKKLSTLNIAFFDEPTQNMDELRRMNLAEQIRRVRGFDQLVVISHDDTFEQGLDSLVRLSKLNGETQLQDDDMMER
ncbi:MAG TPA: SMC family ATPase, partial [Ktedonosporobacter sp.]|nr:SMC family ATPase [Ktedonosporobacter sp.]